MKQKLTLAATLALMLTICLFGCHVSAVAPPPPPGAVDSIDGNAYKVLAPIHAFAASVSASVHSGKLQLTQTQLDSLNALNGALNVADAAEIAYHNAGGGDASALNAGLAAAQASWLNAQAVFASITK